MARTLEQLDADLATAEQRIQTLRNRADNIHDQVARLEAQMELVKEIGETIPALRKVRKMLNRARARVPASALTETIRVRGKTVRRLRK